MDIEYFPMNAIWNTSIHFLHPIFGGFSASYQNIGNQANADGVSDFDVSAGSAMSLMNYNELYNKDHMTRNVFIIFLYTPSAYIYL